MDADTGNSCLVALNMLCDEFNGSGSFLFREMMTSGTVSAASGTLGTTWAAIPPGTKPLGATYNDGSGEEELIEWTFAQYQSTYDKTLVDDPEYFAWDGYATVFFYPVPTSLVIKLRTRQTFADFADLETDYDMPQGYKTAFADLLAEKMSPQLLGKVPEAVTRNAAAARSRLLAKNMRPAIINAGSARVSILSGP